jgi:hypothetical protein
VVVLSIEIATFPQTPGHCLRIGDLYVIAGVSSISCLQVGNLKYLKTITDLPLIQLLGGWPGYVTPDTGATHSEMVSDAGLDEIAMYASGVGLWKDTILPPQDSGYIGPSTGLVQRIQSRDLQVCCRALGYTVHTASCSEPVSVLSCHPVLSEKSRYLVGKQYFTPSTVWTVCSSLRKGVASMWL